MRHLSTTAAIAAATLALAGCGSSATKTVASSPKPADASLAAAQCLRTKLYSLVAGGSFRDCSDAVAVQTVNAAPSMGALEVLCSAEKVRGRFYCSANATRKGIFSSDVGTYFVTDVGHSITYRAAP